MTISKIFINSGGNPILCTDSRIKINGEWVKPKHILQKKNGVWKGVFFDTAGAEYGYKFFDYTWDTTDETIRGVSFDNCFSWSESTSALKYDSTTDINTAFVKIKLERFLINGDDTISININQLGSETPDVNLYTIPNPTIGSSNKRQISVGESFTFITADFEVNDELVLEIIKKPNSDFEIDNIKVGASNYIPYTITQVTMEKAGTHLKSINSTMDLEISTYSENETLARYVEEYQWLKNGVPIENETENKISVTHDSVEEVSYVCTVSAVDEFATDAEREFFKAVSEPAIIQWSEGYTLDDDTFSPCVASNVTIAEGSHTIVGLTTTSTLHAITTNINKDHADYSETYQWYLDGVELVGETKSTLDVTSDTVMKEIYHCEVNANTTIGTIDYLSQSATIEVSFVDGYIVPAPLRITFDQTDETDNGVTYGNTWIWDEVKGTAEINSTNHSFLEFSKNIESIKERPEYIKIKTTTNNGYFGVIMKYTDGSSSNNGGNIGNGAYGTSYPAVNADSNEELDLDYFYSDINAGKIPSSIVVFRYAFEFPDIGSGVDYIEYGEGEGFVVKPYASSDVVLDHNMSMTCGIGLDITLSVTAINVNDTLEEFECTYQWFKDGVAIDGANSAELTTSSTETGVISYYCVVDANTKYATGEYVTTSNTVTVTYARAYTDTYGLVAKFDDNSEGNEMLGIMIPSRGSISGDQLNITSTTTGVLWTAEFTYRGESTFQFDYTPANYTRLWLTFRVLNLDGSVASIDLGMPSGNSAYDGLDVPIVIGETVTYIADTPVNGLVKDQKYILECGQWSSSKDINGSFDNIYLGTTGVFAYEQSTNVTVGSALGNMLPLGNACVLNVTADNTNMGLSAYQEFYQWFIDGTEIVGATENILDIDAYFTDTDLNKSFEITCRVRANEDSTMYETVSDVFTLEIIKAYITTAGLCDFAEQTPDGVNTIFAEDVCYSWDEDKQLVRQISNNFNGTSSWLRVKVDYDNSLKSGGRVLKFNNFTEGRLGITHGTKTGHNSGGWVIVTPADLDDSGSYIVPDTLFSESYWGLVIKPDTIPSNIGTEILSNRIGIVPYVESTNAVVGSVNGNQLPLGNSLSLEVESDNENSWISEYKEYYQWYKDGVKISGEKGKTLDIDSNFTDADLNNTFEITCRVRSNENTSDYQVMSSSFSLEIIKGFIGLPALYTNSPAMVSNSNSSVFYNRTPAFDSIGSKLLLKFTVSDAALIHLQRIIKYSGMEAIVDTNASLYLSGRDIVRDNVQDVVLNSGDLMLKHGGYYELEFERTSSSSATVLIGSYTLAMGRAADIYIHEIRFTSPTGDTEKIHFNVTEGRILESDTGNNYNIVNLSGASGEPAWVSNIGGVQPYEPSTITSFSHNGSGIVNEDATFFVAVTNANEIQTDYGGDFYAWFVDDIEQPGETNTSFIFNSNISGTFEIKVRVRSNEDTNSYETYDSITYTIS